MILFLTISLISVLLTINSNIVLSPFDYSSIYTPAAMYRTSYTATTLGTSKTFTITFPSQAYNATPIFLYSVSALTLNRGINFNMSIAGQTTSSLDIVIVCDSTVTKGAFSILIMNSILYQATFTPFIYTMPPGTNTPQDIIITDSNLHNACFLVGMKTTLGPFPSGNSIIVNSQVYSYSTNIVTSNLSMLYDPSQLAIDSLYMYFVDFDPALFIGEPYAGRGQQFFIYGSSGFATDTTQTGAYLSIYSKNYFAGLQAIYSGQFLFSLQSFDIAKMLSTNIYYFISQLLFVSYMCPSSFPYTDNVRQYCYSDCQIGFYSDEQYICKPCNSNCKTCNATSVNCTSCNSPYVLSYGYVCACIANAYQTNYPNGSIACLVCSTYIFGCYSCTSPTHCTSCVNNLILQSPVLCQCPTGTVLKSTVNTSYCVQTSPASTPQTCPSNLIKFNIACICDYPHNLTTLINGVCQ